MKTNSISAPEIAPYDSANNYKGHTILNIKGTYYNLAVSYVPPGEEGRKVHGGPMVPGPWAKTFGLCSVIHNGSSESKANEAKNKAARTVEVSDGDEISIDGNRYSVKVFRREYIALSIVS